ncbi:hydrogenase maturation nickel metallochaperone HypA [Mycobacterium shigaense]|uniref:Hydrogenase maturation factor HypA n=1 Tax=Mycobacterium shigaense TaxID=722731 RepID=A0A1Z4EHT1_9MYCO|nr:hydrogenase maturation nickel metallochaperone HypA [Mycobacterium shigaense]MEA1124723.1 hydrogenase maturation nickel metallochaperone HypA [Mycobacterium shigaense]PRI14115.1 hydrogenase expression protein HupH [Mycobacterium shigaense]BAX92538.1 hydrogenase expression protein HupH [Mycobacterium shigaense]
MHELSLCHAIAGVVKPHAVGRHVDVVRVQVGALRQVVPESLEFCWSLVCQHLDENMVDTVLELELVPAEVFCRDCTERALITSRWSVCCPSCQSADVDVLRGNEFLVTSVEVSEGFDYQAESRKVK